MKVTNTSVTISCRGKYREMQIW